MEPIYGDTFTLAGARNLAKRIQAYWQDRGGEVKTSLIENRLTKEGRVYFLRSDMVNGLPRKVQQ